MRVLDPNPRPEATQDTSGSTLLDHASLPVEDLARLAMREAIRPRPIYQAHRWFARRFGSAFRALLTAAALAPGQDFWDAYYAGVNWRGRTVLDPFVGGGTSMVEATRLGATVIGGDVDAVACAITRFETRARELPDLSPTLSELKRTVGMRLAPYYRSIDDAGVPVDVLHFFWVQVVDCRGCGRTIEVHPHHQLAYQAEGTYQWAFCRHCHGIQRLPRIATMLHCAGCDLDTEIGAGCVHYGRLTCPHCRQQERLIDVAARTGRPPDWRLFALEVVHAWPSRRAIPLAERAFQPARAADQELLVQAAQALDERTRPDGEIAWIPERRIPTENRFDGRLPAYGYTHYRDLFNARQLLHLSHLAEAIAAHNNPLREALALAFSDHLTTNCLLTHYAVGWRRVAPLFSLRAYRHVPRPVEINPWMDGTGRGTFPNAVHAVQAAARDARKPREALREGGFQATPQIAPVCAPRILHQDARRLALVAAHSVDLVLTDPPYFDNIAYSELSDFFLPWLQMLGLVLEDEDGISGWDANLAAKARDPVAAASFQQGLVCCFREMGRVMKPDARLVFTYQHQAAGAWVALGTALAWAGFQVVNVFPLLGDGMANLHTHAGSIRWDAVFVLRPGTSETTDRPLLVSEADRTAAETHSARWASRLAKHLDLAFRSADAQNFQRASFVAAALGWFSGGALAAHGTPLADVLQVPARLSAPAQEAVAACDLPVGQVAQL